MFQSSLGLLPFLASLLWTAFFYLRAPETFRSWRWCLSLGCLLLGILTMGITEALSSMHLLSFIPLLFVWSMMTLLPGLVLWSQGSRINAIRELDQLWKRIPADAIWILILITVGLILIVRMAVASPPNNFDVQSYHLPRQIYWLMQGSVAHFHATYPYQNSHPVLTEYLGLNLMILSGGDGWHNLVQAYFFLVASGLVTLISKSLGASARGQAFAVLFVMLVPVVFFEASNAKNDIVASFFLLVPLLIGMRIWTREWKPGVPLLMIAALAAGLAMATKGTSAAYLPASAVLIAVASLRCGAWRTLLLATLPALLLAVLPMIPNTIRNIRTFHSPSGPGIWMVSDRHDPSSVVGVVIKNTANQFAFGSEQGIQLLEKSTRSLLQWLGLDPDDPHTNIGAEQLGGSKLHFFYTVGCEDVIPAPVQTALCLLIPLFLLFPSFREKEGTVPLACIVVGSFLLFCAIFRWQPWGGRLLIPEFFMAAPLVSKAEEMLMPRWLPILLIGLQMAFLWPQISYSGQRHLLGWWSVFRMSKEEQMSIAFVGQTEEIKKVTGLIKAEGIGKVMIDGKDTAIYGLLRGIHSKLPMVNLCSGDVAVPTAHDVKAIVEALVGTESPVPKGFREAWSGKYYRLYFRIP